MGSLKNHDFLKELLSTNSENRLFLKFTGHRSFADFRGRVTMKMSQKLKDELDFEDAISLYIRYPERKSVRFILVKNDNQVMLDIPKGYSVPVYSFDKLLTEKEESFLHTNYKTYRLFNEKGKMLR